ncbi:hypothetical protein OUHCRE13_15270 [Enterobacter roggenkampii]
MVTETVADKVMAAIMVTGILVTPVTMVISKIADRITLENRIRTSKTAKMSVMTLMLA